MYQIELCLSPVLFDYRKLSAPFTTVIVDIFRATTCFCTALYNGVQSIIPINDLETLQKMKNQGFLTAAERGGKKVSFADFGNDPNAYCNAPEMAGKALAYSTTNGTVAIGKAVESGCQTIVIASFLNITAITDFLIRQQQNVLILCAGWHQQFSYEDTFFAGALAERLLQNPNFDTSDDAITMACILWNNGKRAPLETLEKNSSHYHRLLGFGITNTLPYALKEDICPIVPYLCDGVKVQLVKL